MSVKLSIRLGTILASLFFLAGCHSFGPQPVANARSAGGLAYDLVGRGPLVVLIHGTNLDRRMWEGEVAWLREHARVLRYDLRGQGASDFPTEAYSNHADLIELLKKWLDTTTEETIGYVGSYGGKPWVRVQTDEGDFVVNADTTRAGVRRFVDLHEQGESWQRIPNSRGVLNKVTNEPTRRPIRGLYMYSA